MYNSQDCGLLRKSPNTVFKQTNKLIKSNPLVINVFFIT